ncbi:MAG TPA: hypothetical protein VF039_14155 [Longimicrobiales bacterium]
MRRNALFALALTAVCVTPIQAQDGERLIDTCQGLAVGDVDVQNENPAAPQVAIDAAVSEIIDEVQFLCSNVATTLSTLQPTIGITFSGGNPTLGMGGTLGTRFGLIPRFSVTARVNAAYAEGPDFEEFASQVGEGEELPPAETRGIPLGAIQGDVAIGVFNGITLVPMLGGLGSIDLLGSVSFIPVIESVGLEEAIVSWGVGARVGILKGGLLAPGLSVSGMYRKLGEVQFGDIEDEDPGEFAMDLSTLSLRAALSKGFAMFDFAVGAGYDKYSSDPAFNFAVECQTNECVAASADGSGITVTMAEDISGDVSTAAWNVFGNVGLSLLLFNLVGEVGYQQATDILTGGDVDGRTLTEEEIGEGRFFGSLGLRLTL